MRGEVVAVDVKRGVTFMSVKNVWVYNIGEDFAIYGYV